MYLHQYNIDDMDDKEDLRLKIKKIKYKIEKEQSLNAALKLRVSQIGRLRQTELSLQKVFKRISALLAEKGITISDWLLCPDYSSRYTLQQLIDVLDRLNIKLDREEKDVLLNFSNQEMSQSTSVEEVKQMALECSVRTD